MTSSYDDLDRPEDRNDAMSAFDDFDDVERELFCSVREAGLTFQLVPDLDR